MSNPLPASPRRVPWWLLLGAVLISCLYLPTLATRFDFIDDGNLVYPSAPMNWDQRISYVWSRIEANYEHLGPFRPVLWVHWETEATLLKGDAFSWRCARLCWTMLATGALLWLLTELGITRYAEIAGWSDNDIAAIDARLGNFKGRPVRDQWVDQAKYLAAGDIAGFEAKYGKL